MTVGWCDFGPGTYLGLNGWKSVRIDMAFHGTWSSDVARACCYVPRMRLRPRRKKDDALYSKETSSTNLGYTQAGDVEYD